MPLKIFSKHDGFRRCGVAHPKNETQYPDGKFTKKEIEILKKEPVLVVVEVAASPSKKEQSKKDRPEDSAAAEADILSAMKQVVDEGKKTLNDGRPDVKAVEKILGWNIDAKERDALMEKLTD